MCIYGSKPALIQGVGGGRISCSIVGGAAGLRCGGRNSSFGHKVRCVIYVVSYNPAYRVC